MHAEQFWFLLVTFSSGNGVRHLEVKAVHEVNDVNMLLLIGFYHENQFDLFALFRTLLSYL